MNYSVASIPGHYLNVRRHRSNIWSMTIELDDSPETKKAWRIASMLYAASLLEQDGFDAAAEHLRIKAAALKFGVPDGASALGVPDSVESFDDDEEVPCDTRTEHNQDEGTCKTKRESLSTF